MRILLADDQVEVRSGLKILLEQEKDMTVVGEASETGEMLFKTEKLKPDLLLLDWELLNLKTSDIVPALRNLSRSTKIVALSGRPEARNSALASGVDGFVSKGDRPDTVLNIINSLFGGEQL